MAYSDAIFKVLESLYTKSDLSIDEEEKKKVALYMVQRWLTMRSPDAVLSVNQTTNRLWQNSSFDLWYPMLRSIVPKMRSPRVSYIKKTTSVAAKRDVDSETIKAIAEYLEISEREVKVYIADGMDVKAFKKQFNI